jgi:hypothetical protein
MARVLDQPAPRDGSLPLRHLTSVSSAGGMFLLLSLLTDRKNKRVSSRQGCEFCGVQVPTPSIARFGRLAGSMHAEGVDLDEVRNRIERWRATWTKRSPMPPKLWQAAADLAPTHGLHAVMLRVHLEELEVRYRLTRSTVPKRRSTRRPELAAEVRTLEARSSRHGVHSDLASDLSSMTRLPGGGFAEKKESSTPAFSYPAGEATNPVALQ